MNNYRGPIILDNSTGTPANPGAYFGFAQSAPTTQRNSTGARLYSGTGNPNGVLTAPIGSLWINDATGIWYQNTDGATTWVPFGTGSGSQTLIYDSGYIAAISATMNTGVLAIPSGAVHLSFKLLSRSDSAVTYDHILGAINADVVDADYISVQSLGDPAVGVLTSPIRRVAASRIIGSAPAATSGAARFGILLGEVPFYNSTAARKSMQAISSDFRTAAGEEFIATGAIERNSVATVTQLGFTFEAAGNFIVGSRLMVYAQ